MDNKNKYHLLRFDSLVMLGVGVLSAILFLASGPAWAVDVTVTSLDVPGAAFTSADDINASGHVVGWHHPSFFPNNRHGYVYDGSTYTTLDFPGADRTLA